MIIPNKAFVGGWMDGWVMNDFVEGWVGLWMVGWTAFISGWMDEWLSLMGGLMGHRQMNDFVD